MHRFFSHHPLSSELKLTPSEQFHQISHVFRAKKGDSFIFFESGWDDKVYEIINLSEKQIILKYKDIIKRAPVWKQKKIKIFQAYPNKIQTVELIIQKIVELGIDEIVLFPSQHSQVKDISESKRTRLESIALEALEQSWRNSPLEISYDSRRVDILWSGNYSNIVGFIGGETTLDTPTGDETLGFWIWPEWWWSDQEKAFFLENKAKLWSFNDNVLRLETATIVGAGILKYLSQIEK